MSTKCQQMLLSEVNFIRDFSFICDEETKMYSFSLMERGELLHNSEEYTTFEAMVSEAASFLSTYLSSFEHAQVTLNLEHQSETIIPYNELSFAFSDVDVMVIIY